jgi:hypothetical protein
MVKPIIDENGVQIGTLADEIEDLSNKFKAIYGDDINIDQDSPDGQRIGIIAKALQDLKEYGRFIYQSFDPLQTSGVALASIGKLQATTPRAPSQSQWNIDITANQTVTLDDTYTIRDDSGQEWVVASPVTIPAGTTTVTFNSVLFGAVIGSTAATFEQVTFKTEITGITATTPAILGRDAETDAQYKRRRATSVANPSLSTTDGLVSRLRNLSGVFDVNVEDNDSDTTSANGTPPHTLWLVIEGGALADIAETIHFNKTGGVGLRGNIEVTYIEEVERPSGTQQILNTYRFDTPTLVDAYVSVVATRKNAATPFDSDFIKEKIASYTTSIGFNLAADNLYSLGLEAGETFILSDMQVSRDGISFTDTEIVAAIDERFVLDPTRVTVTEVIP